MQKIIRIISIVLCVATICSSALIASAEKASSNETTSSEKISSSEETTSSEKTSSSEETTSSEKEDSSAETSSSEKTESSEDTDSSEDTTSSEDEDSLKGQLATIIGENVKIREKSTTNSDVVTMLSNVTVTVNFSEDGEQAEKNGTKTWFNITYTNSLGEVFTGFVYGNYISINPEYVYDPDFELNLLNFPESYHEPLRQLHAKFPNWQFATHNIDMTFKEAVEAQYGVKKVADTRKWVEFTFGGNEWRDMRAYDEDSKTWLTLESRWTYASRSAIEYYMDPRNSLDESRIFVFMQQSYQADDNLEQNLSSVVRGTFLENGYDKNGDGDTNDKGEKDAYITDIISAAKKSKVSPYVLAATIIVEQGTNGETDMVSGTYKGFEGYYNFFNFSASGSTTAEITKSALTYAKKSGWNSRTAAIEGGAEKYADGYINVGQDTYYYKDFNVVNQIWNHQYATALYDAWTNANYLKKGFIANTDATITFTIPVYKDMPDSACEIPSAISKPTTSEKEETQKEDDTSKENNTSEKPVESEPEPVIPKGDPNFDGEIDVVDLAAVKMHILDIKELKGDALKSGDINDDGVVDVVDLAAVKMHILGLRKIK